MANTPNITLQPGQPIPAGYVVGRITPGTGQQELISIADLSQQVTAMGGATGGGGGGGSLPTLTDGQLIIGSTGNPPVAATLTAGSGIGVINAAGSITLTASGGGGGTGLFSSVMSAVPTAANTGLSTWVHQNSASVADTAVGITITGISGASSQNNNLRTKAAIATPYTVTALMAITVLTPSAFGTFGLGWYDGTNKIQMIEVNQRNNTAPPLLVVASYSTPTALNTTHYGPGSSSGNPGWVQISDDGTNVFFRYSSDGANFKTAYTVAKASGYLGSSGYSNICISCNGFATDMFATLMSYRET